MHHLKRLCDSILATFQTSSLGHADCHSSPSVSRQHFKCQRTIHMLSCLTACRTHPNYSEEYRCCEIFHSVVKLCCNRNSF
ncbi:hypothetical protein TcWFU_006955 [Taenia crassiceps]|uniref:Uncharacterized protein n=1 Tax=Taenia crassiceps TaxID=6207 RepID=A0ABR4QMH9_9CEST